MVGKIFGKWTVTSLSSKRGASGKKLYYNCACLCGRSGTVEKWKLVHGLSCGCKSCAVSEKNFKHGRSKSSPLYATWKGMRQRCQNPKTTYYKDYGGRGIKTCVEWDSFPVFEEWAMMNGYIPGKQIDRKENNGNYEPENCRFVRSRENNRNRRDNRPLTAFGETKLQCEWLEDPRCRANAAMLSNRVHRLGWPSELSIITGKHQIYGGAASA